MLLICCINSALVGGRLGITVMQSTQLITILGGGAGYLLTVNSYMAEVAEPEERTAAFGVLAGVAMLGVANGGFNSVMICMSVFIQPVALRIHMWWTEQRLHRIIRSIRNYVLPPCRLNVLYRLLFTVHTTRRVPGEQGPQLDHRGSVRGRAEEGCLYICIPPLPADISSSKVCGWERNVLGAAAARIRCLLVCDGDGIRRMLLHSVLPLPLISRSNSL